MRPRPPERTLILGAGPAGLMAGYVLANAGLDVCVVERAPQVGGLSGSHGFEAASGTYRFDFGGHRFITANRELLHLVDELLGEDLLTAERSSVIRFEGRTYRYPLALPDLLRNAPIAMLAGALRDLIRVSLTRPGSAESFAEWIEARFGHTLYRAFFEGYTRKLWGIDPRHLSADWAAQRISLIDLRDVARRLVPGARATPRTYARRYRYPRTGFGLLFERLAERFVEAGGQLVLGTRVEQLELASGRIVSVVGRSPQGECRFDAEHFVSTLPLPELVRLSGGDSKLRFRGLRFFQVLVDRPDVSPYTWQYLSDPELVATRLQEPKRRSPFMSPPGRTSLMFEIPCDPGDELWECSDAQLYSRVCRDLELLGVDSAALTGESFSRRAPCAYPLMDLDYARERARSIAWLNQFSNLSLCGRQGTFRYIFSDTAMEMGLGVARSLIEAPERRPDVLELRNEPTVIEVESVV